MNPKKKSLEELQQEVRALKKRAGIILEERKTPKRKPVNIFAIIVLMTVVWGMYGLELYQKHHPSQWYRWYLVALCLALAVGASGYLVYFWNQKKIYIGRKFTVNEWVYRDEDPLCYWFYVAIYSFFDGVFIYGFLTLLIKGSF
ncbi:MAG: hypothetical protein RL616_1361 [Verrucomicrobiota bacterium]